MVYLSFAINQQVSGCGRWSDVAGAKHPCQSGISIDGHRDAEDQSTNQSVTRLNQHDGDPKMSNTANLSLFAARVLLSIMFLMSGYAKLMDPAATIGMITAAGIPAATLLTYLTGTFELVASLAVIVGFQTSAASILLAGFTLFTALVFHSGPISIPGFPPEANGLLSTFNNLMMMKNISITGGFLALAVIGAGAFSVDAKRTPASQAA